VSVADVSCMQSAAARLKEYIARHSENSSSHEILVESINKLRFERFERCAVLSLLSTRSSVLTLWPRRAMAQVMAAASGGVPSESKGVAVAPGV
jgi:hypothetical protein